MQIGKIEEFGYLLDEEQRIKRWPKKSREKQFVLEYLQSKLTPGTRYREQEVNAVLQRWHLFNDYALLRREMYDRFLLHRTRDGRQYWIG